MVWRKVAGGVIVAIATTIGVAIFGGMPSRGPIGALLPIALFFLFGYLDTIVPFFLALIGLICFLPVARATASAMVFLTWTLLLIADTWTAQGMIGASLDGFLKSLFYETRFWILGALYLTVAFILALPSLRRRTT